MITADNKPAPASTPVAKAEVKPVAKTESASAVKPADTIAAKPADSVAKAVAKVESRQAGKGSKRRPFNAKIFGANYGAIQWGHGQAQRPKH